LDDDQDGGWVNVSMSLKRLAVKRLLLIVVPPPHHNRFMALFPGPPREPVPEENFWTLGAMEDQQRQKHQPSGWAPLRLD